MAVAVLEAMGLSAADLPARRNVSRQRNVDCGFWVLYWMEEHCRRQRGEPAWGFDYDLPGRIKKIMDMKRKLKKRKEAGAGLTPGLP